MLPSFINFRPLDRYAYGSVGGPVSRTSVIRSAGGQEQRNAEWGDFPLRRYDLIKPIGDGANLSELMGAVIICRGRTIPFRFKDHLDFNATDEAIDVSGGGPVYQLRKKYSFGGFDVYRNIVKPVLGTVAVYLNAVPVTITQVEALSNPNDLWNEPLFGETIISSTGVTLDYNNGILRWYSEPYPTIGDTLTWTGQFDVPVRFDMDWPRFEMSNFGSYQLQTFPITEVRDF